MTCLTMAAHVRTVPVVSPVYLLPVVVSFYSVVPDTARCGLYGQCFPEASLLRIWFVIYKPSTRTITSTSMSDLVPVSDAS